MNDILDFIVQNWQWILISFLSLLSFLISLFKRNKNILYDNSILSVLIQLVNDAEALYGAGNGEKKLEYVLTTYFNSYPAAKPYEVSVRKLVELILSTPHKKNN